jgi:tRNA(fMet)-specific endonuclease VapC
MHLLDTDTLTHLHAGHPQVIAHLRALDDPVVGTTIITKSELLRGRIDFLLKAATGAELLRAQQWFTRTEELLAQILTSELYGATLPTLTPLSYLPLVSQAKLVTFTPFAARDRAFLK